MYQTEVFATTFFQGLSVNTPPVVLLSESVQDLLRYIAVADSLHTATSALP